MAFLGPAWLEDGTSVHVGTDMICTMALDSISHKIFHPHTYDKEWCENI